MTHAVLWFILLRKDYHMISLLSKLQQTIEKQKSISVIKQRNKNGPHKFSPPFLTPEQEYNMSTKGDSKDAKQK